MLRGELAASRGNVDKVEEYIVSYIPPQINLPNFSAIHGLMVCHPSAGGGVVLGWWWA